MMFRVSKTPQSLAVFPCRTGAIGLAMVLLQAAPGVVQPAMAQQGWGTKLESQAEFAYRSVFERSLTNAKRQKPMRAARRKPQAPAPAPAPLATSAIPDVPVSKAAALAEPAPIRIDSPAVTGAGADVPPEPGAEPSLSVLAPVEEPAAPDAADNRLVVPLIDQPRNLGDVLTTAVAGEEPAGDNTQPATVLRGSGDQYCTNIANAAADARFAWQKQELLQTEEQVKQRIGELEGKITEYRKWLARRDEFSKRAQASVTTIYAKMRPDAAAQQLSVLDEETAAAVISQLNPRVASALMAEMDAKIAARLTAIISASARGPKGKPPGKPTVGGT